MDLEDFDGNIAYAYYSTFSIGDNTTNYKLNVGGYSGTAGKYIKHDCVGGSHIKRINYSVDHKLYLSSFFL